MLDELQRAVTAHVSEVCFPRVCIDMAADIADLLRALKTWQKAVKHLNHQDQSLAERQQQLEQASKTVLQYLSADTVEAEIESLLQQASPDCEKSAQAVRNSLRQDPETLITVELRSLYPLNVSRTQFQKGAIATPPIAPDAACLEDSEQLQKVFLLLSSALAEEYQTTADLSRKPKKRRRRDVTLGALQTLLGVGLLAGNTQLEISFANASYILGGNALLSALQNLLGQLDAETGKPLT